MIPLSDSLEGVLAALDRLEIKYLVGGSVASSIHGTERSTMDVDFLVEITVAQVDDFVDALGPNFCADADAIRSAIRAGRAFNIIDTGSIFKFDFFPTTSDPYHPVQMGRRMNRTTKMFGREIEFAVASPEDLVLNKLRWYRLGGETSGRQWEDLEGVVARQRTRLDLDYLRHWAAHLGVTDLLERLLQSTIRPSRI